MFIIIIRVTCRNSHIDFLPTLGMDRPTAYREALLYRFPAVVITTPGQHCECFLEASFPGPLVGAQPQMPLCGISICSESQQTVQGDPAADRRMLPCKSLPCLTWPCNSHDRSVSQAGLQHLG